MTASPQGGYSGVDNLEVMEEAVNYNAYLQSLIIARARLTDEILDFGAGSGVLARPLAAAGYRIRCVEPDDGLRARLQAGGLMAHAAIEDIPTASLDLIYTVNVLEHIADDVSAVAGLRARLKPAGRLIAYVPAFPILYSSMDRKVGHIRRYRRDELADLLRRTGLRVEHVAYQDSIGFAAAVVFKLFGNQRGVINRRGLLAYDRWVFPLSRSLDRYAGGWFGKNLVAVGRRDD